MISNFKLVVNHDIKSKTQIKTHGISLLSLSLKAKKKEFAEILLEKIA